MCEHLNIEGTHVIVCGARKTRRYCACGHAADFLCDWKVPAKKSGTCDAPICSKHAKQVAPEKHLCPAHQLQYVVWKRNHPASVGSVNAPKQKTLFEGAA